MANTFRTIERPASVPEPLPARHDVDLPLGRGERTKNRLLGPPLATENLVHERLGKPTALAVFASDNLSSSAYATEEILRVLVPPSAWPPSRSSCRSPWPCWWCWRS